MIEAVFNHDDATNPNWRSMHMALIPQGGAIGHPWNTLRGKVLVYDEGPNYECFSSNLTPWAIFDPSGPRPGPWLSHRAEAQSEPLPMLLHPVGAGNLACSGHTWTADGRLFVAGGNEKHNFAPFPHPPGPCILGGKQAYLFDPTRGSVGNEMWHEQPPLQTRRWYPSVVLMGERDNSTTWLDNRILVLGGDHEPPLANKYQVFRPPTASGTAGSWEPKSLGPPVEYRFNGPAYPSNSDFHTYPYTHLMSDGKVVVARFAYPEVVHLRHDVAPEAWTPLFDANPRVRVYGCSLLFPNLDANHRNSLVALGGSNGIAPDPTTAMPDWQMCRPQQVLAGAWPGGHWWTGLDPAPDALPSMVHPRYFPNAVLLPDGSFLVIGGEYALGITSLASLNAIERWDGQWLPCASLLPFPGHTEGGYGLHSTALLLPDGKVLIGGGNLLNSGFKRYDYQIYAPWYIACGAPRPQIVSVNNGVEEVTYGSTIPVAYQAPPGVAIGKVVLMRPSSVTHGRDTEQRYIELEFTDSPNGSDEIDVQMPAKWPGQNGITASDVTGPPGYYMLFVLTSTRIPSVAAWVRLKP